MKRSCIVWAVVLGLGAMGAQAFGAQASVAEKTAAPVVRLKRHPVVALTFDDLPAAGGLPDNDTRVGIATRLTEVLRANHLKGVYGFVTAVDLDDDPDTHGALKVWMDAGMKIGNHTWSHPALSDVTAADYIHELAEDEPALKQYAGKTDWHWFRYPYLEEGDTVAKHEAVRGWLRAHGYKVAEVTLNFNDDDWSDPYLRCLAKHDEAGIAWLKQSYMASAKEFIRRGRERQKAAFGHEIPNVLLLHATAFTTLMAPAVIQMLRQEGFRFASLEKVERDRAYSIDPEVGMVNGGPFAYEVLVMRHLKDSLPPPTVPEPVTQLDSVCK
ncbi:MAG TPA: polysaccharide deacetylase family protein [Acidobacteriaceae bacterium]|nr:polysaccharide deacetylase family protein [Acidobacteriaceae bacterium]